MKTSVYVRVMAVASIAFAPLAAHSQDSETIQACVNAFVAQNFPDQSPTVELEKEDAVRMPFALSSPSFRLQLTAVKRATGRVLVTATCTERRGVVTLTPNNSIAVIAAR